MTESDVLDANVRVCSDDSDFEGLSSLDIQNPLANSEVHDIFKAAQYLSQQDRINVVSSAKKIEICQILFLLKGFVSRM